MFSLYLLPLWAFFGITFHYPHLRKVSDQSVSVQKIRTRVFQIFTLFLAAGLSDKVGRDGEVAGKGLWVEKQNLFNIAIFDIGIGERICVSLTDVTTSGILDGKLYDVRVGEVVVERRLRVEKLIQYWYRSLRTRFVFLWPTLSPLESWMPVMPSDSEDH